MRVRRVLGWLVLAGVLLAAAVAFPPLWLEIDETAVPPASEAPVLPEGVDATFRGIDCGSGGCWREWRLDGPADATAAELAERLGLAAEQCEPRWLLDRRRVCTGTTVVGDEVRLYLRYARAT